jgi:hypothetical protein
MGAARLGGGLSAASLSACYSTGRTGQFSPTSQSNGGRDTASSPKRTSDVLPRADPKFGHHSFEAAGRAAAQEDDRNPAAVADHTVTPIALGSIIGDSKSIDPKNWDALSATERVAFLQRWLMYAEVKYKGPIADWSEAFAKEWVVVKDSPSASQCLIAASQKVTAGKLLLNYVARAMEGVLPRDLQEWRALYVQAYHITGSVNRACTSLQCKIDAALAENV